ncbi:hypothetical protein EAH89_15960 [Roseomonas nepalensis]|uniref:PhnA-like protein n=2 Tax=Muricoccus nepalensis TaxID=1854500 RepID=A0A502FWF3_9PROT|nr:hypothetical protein EAH89_15960 [Roseomonas nepalensis]
MLNVLGAAIGATFVDATARDTPNASSFGIGAGVWLLVSNLIGLGVGGYAAARLSGTASRTDATLHGLAMWAASFLISAVLLGNVVAGVASTAANGVTGALGGIARGAGSVASAAGEQVANRTSTGAAQSAAQGVIDRVQSALAGTGNAPASMTSDQRKAEIATLAGRRVTNGNLSDGDRERLNTLVAAEYNISPDEARQRVTQAEQQAQQALQQAEQRAREAADATAKGASVASFSIFLTMLLGLVVAVVGARRGTRDSVSVRSNRLA